MPEFENNCIVTLDSRQVMQGQEDSTVTTVPAFRTERNGHTYIYYTVYYDDNRECKNKEFIKIVDNKTVEIVRTGLLKAKMLFKENESTVTDYSSPAGQLTMCIDTKKLDISIT